MGDINRNRVMLNVNVNFWVEERGFRIFYKIVVVIAKSTEDITECCYWLSFT